jgi:hypothetical protein
MALRARSRRPCRSTSRGECAFRRLLTGISAQPRPRTAVAPQHRSAGSRERWPAAAQAPPRRPGYPRHRASARAAVEVCKSLDSRRSPTPGPAAESRRKRPSGGPVRQFPHLIWGSRREGAGDGRAPICQAACMGLPDRGWVNAPMPQVHPELLGLRESVECVFITSRGSEDVINPLAEHDKHFSLHRDGGEISR